MTNTKQEPVAYRYLNDATQHMFFYHTESGRMIKDTRELPISFTDTRRKKETILSNLWNMS